MKKILKYYLPATIFFFALGIFFLIYMIENHTPVLKYFAGEVWEGKAKNISKKIDAIVKEDGVEQDRIKLFEDEGKIYVVFQKTQISGLGILIVDKERNDIYAPLVGSCYDLLFSKYLLQAECGKSGDYLGSEKHGSYGTKMVVADSQINFQLPEYNYGKVVRNRQMEIIFKGE